MTEVLTGTRASVGKLSGTLQPKNSLSANLTMKLVEDLDYEKYTGETVFTPSRETQIIGVSHMTVMEDITINPIPSNYGLITWNGSTLTVS